MAHTCQPLPCLDSGAAVETKASPRLASSARQSPHTQAQARPRAAARWRRRL
jgi:hypothetical protein